MSRRTVFQRLFLLNACFALFLALLLMVARLNAGSVKLGFGSLLCLTVLGLWAGGSLLSWGAIRRGYGLFAARIWTAAAAFVVPYVVVEAMLAVIGGMQLSPLISPDETLHHVLQSNALSEIYTDEFHYLQRVNTLGLRGSEVELQKAAGVCRILMLGDSFTMGTGVRDTETFSAVLQDQWNVDAGASGNCPVEVLNAGVESYSPILCYLQLKQLQPVLKPDIVVLNFDVSDLLQETAYRKLARFAENGDVLGVSGVQSQSIDSSQNSIKKIRLWIRRHLVLTRVLVSWLDRWQKESAQLTVDNTVRTPHTDLLRHTLESDTVDRDQQWASVFDSLRRIKAYCESQGILLVMTLYPWGHQVSEREWVTGRSSFVRAGAGISDRSVKRMESFAAAEDIPVLNAYSAFREHRGEERLYHMQDMHWTAAGHRLMAQQLQHFLRDRLLCRKYMADTFQN